MVYITICILTYITICIHILPVVHLLYIHYITLIDDRGHVNGETFVD